MRRLISLLLIAVLVCNVAQAGFGGYLRADTAKDLIVGPFIDDTDGKTAETGLTITQAEVRLSKNGGNMAQKNEATALSHDELGNYVCKVDTTDTDTEGILTLMIHESGALAIKVEYMVVNANVFDSLFAAATTDYLQVDTIQVSGTSQTSNDMSGDINTILTDTEAQDTTIEIRTLMTGSDTTVATQAKQDTIDNFIDTEIGTIVTAVGNIETDTAAQDTAGEWDTLMATVDGKLDTAQADLDTITGASGVLIDTDAVDADALKTDAVTEIWAAAMSDLAAGAPSATASVLTAINYLYEAWRNQTWATSTEIAIYKDDASTPLVESTISDDGTTFKREEMRAPD